MSAATYSRYPPKSSLSSLGWAALFLFLSASAYGHRLDGSNYSGHDASLCAYADGNTAGSVSCSDPLANPCYSGRSTSTHNPNVAGHGHAGYPPGKATTAACIAFQRANPRNTHCDDRHCIDPNDQRVFFEHNAADHACSVCENGKCGFWGTQEARHRHEGLCPDETCAHGEACDGYGEHDPTDHDCESCDDQNGTCGYHLGHRHPGQCPNIIVDPPPPAESCECCEGVQVTKGEGETCEQTCGSLLRQHPLACSDDDPPVDPPCAHGDACDGYGEHTDEEHLCDSCDDRDGTCGWLNGHRHPNQCPNDPDWDPPDEPITPPPPECPVCPICPYRPPCPDCPPPVTEYVEFCPVKPPQWGTDSW